MRTPILRLLATAALVGLGVLSGAATAEVVIKVGYGPGGTNDVYARLAARHLPRFLHDSPEIEVVNVPGAGGKKLLKLAQNASETDGSVIYMTTFTVAANDVISLTAAGREAPELRFIGSFGRDHDICWGKSDSPISGVNDILHENIRFGASGKASITYTLPAAMRAILGAPFKIVTGFAGTAELFAALERGEVDLVCGSDPVVAASFRRVGEIYRANDGATDEFGIPALIDIALDPAELAVLHLLERQAAPSGTMYLPPATPDAVVMAFRSAFTALLADPAYQADLAATRIGFAPISGAELEALYSEVIHLDPVQRAQFLSLTK